MMRETDRSFGIVPLRQDGDTWNVFLVRHRAGHWGFPKGHPNSGETALQTAARELYEETQLKLTRLISEDSLTESYHFEKNGKQIHKIVEYFFALVEGKAKVDGQEVLEGAWLSLPAAKERISFAESKKILDEAIKRLLV